MRNLLENIFHERCENWNQWILSYQNFISTTKHDSIEKIYQHRNTPSYCIWEERDDCIITISYRYVHILTMDGGMHCLQESSLDKIKLLENYKKLGPKNYLPILDKIETSNNTLYTKFLSPTGILGYPSAYTLFQILINDKEPIKNFKRYIKRIIDTYIDLCTNCLEKNITPYSCQRILTSSFYSHNIFYLKDNIFYLENNKYESDENIRDSLIGIIDGFRRAQGVVNVYKLRKDSSEGGVKQMFSAIESLKAYARMKCQNLKNVDQLLNK